MHYHPHFYALKPRFWWGNEAFKSVEKGSGILKREKCDNK